MRAYAIISRQDGSRCGVYKARHTAESMIHGMPEFVVREIDI